MGLSVFAKSVRGRTAGIILLGLLSAHLALVLRQFPPTSLARGGLPVKGDVARYLATVDGTQRIGRGGDDPLAMAGYPVGLWNSMGKKGYELLLPLMPGSSLGTRFYLSLVVIAIISP